jgi:hypothetical protein
MWFGRSLPTFQRKVTASRPQYLTQYVADHLSCHCRLSALVPRSCRLFLCNLYEILRVIPSNGIIRIYLYNELSRSRDSTVGITNGLRTGRPGFNSRQRQEILFYFTASRGPLRLLSNNYRGSFRGDKAGGA